MSEAFSADSRPYHLVVFGATGFTAKFVLQEIYSHGASQWPQNFSWAIAGRNRDALHKLAVPKAAQAPHPDVLVADLNNAEQILQVAASTKLLLNCVGPYSKLGEPIVHACVKAKTNYLDLCGEPEFIERMWLMYDEPAREAGISIVHAAAFDSVPADLGVIATIEAIKRRGSTPINIEMLFRYRSGDLGFGAHFPTYASAVEGFASSRSKLRQIRKSINEKLGAPPRPPGKRAPLKLGFLGYFYYDPRAEGWLIPYFFSDPAIVRLTQRLSTHPAHANSFGSNISPINFSAYMVIPSLWYLLISMFFFSIFRTLTQRSWGRYLLLSFPSFFTAGIVSHEGPSQEQLEQTSFTQTFHGEGIEPDSKVTLRITGPEAGYVITPIIFVACARAALGPKGDNMPRGVVTPGIAFQGLLERLSSEGRVSVKID